ncbi:MAG: TonB-dependent receptor [Caulobacteraceae bacterium]|nr:TonB-dependent receptor [Caulobacteraceae bacterium]
MRNNKVFLRCFGASLLGGVSAVSLGWGSASAADQAADNRGGATVPEIVVTARKRSEDLQKVPISITAFNADEIEKRGFKTMDDIAQSVPNFQFSRLTTLSNELSIRGINSGDSEPGFETGIAVILDDVYIGRAVGFDTTLVDINSIEVLRGPQGTLQGRNVIGGSINVTTAPPSFTFSGLGEAEYGNYNLRDIRASVNGPIVDDLVAAKLSVAYRGHDGFGENVDLHKPLDTEDTLAARAQILAQPSSNLRILFTADIDHENNHDMHNGFGPPSDTTLPAATVSRKVGGDIWNSGHNVVYGAALNIYYDLGKDLSLTSVSSYRGYDATDLQEGDGAKNFGAAGAGAFLATAFNKQDQHQFSEELRIASAAGKTSPLSWLAGVYYYEDTLHNYANFLEGINTGSVIAGSSGISNATTRTDSAAGFASATYSFDSRYSVTGGVRYTYDHRDVTVAEVDGFDGVDPIYGTYTYEPTLANPAPTHFADSIYYPVRTNSHIDRVWTGDLTFNQNWTGDVSTYVKYARGFKGSGFNTGYNNGASGDLVKPEFVDSYEVGWRSDLMDHRLRLNATGYYVSHTNQQVQVFDASTFTYVTSNEPSTRSYGVEIDAKWAVSRELSVGLALGTINSRVTKGPDKGLVVPYSSPETVTVTADYVRPVSGGVDFYCFPEVSWRDGYYTDPTDARIGYQTAYWWVSARLGFRSPDKRWSIGLFGHNLTNSTVIASASNVPGYFSVAFLEQPRTFGIDARHSF